MGTHPPDAIRLFALALDQARREAGLTEEQLAHRLGYKDRQVVGNWKRRPPKQATIVKIETALNRPGFLQSALYGPVGPVNVTPEQAVQADDSLSEPAKLFVLTSLSTARKAFPR